MIKSGIEEAINFIKQFPKNKVIKVVSHFDTDGITSAAIFTKALQRADIRFSLEIIKNLESSFIESLPEDDLIIFLDLGSGSLSALKNKKNKIIILDHHILEYNEIPNNILMINPIISQEEQIASSGLCYIFAKTLSENNKDLATLAVIGMVGDMMEKNIGKNYDEILKDASVIVKKGLLLYPATRPIDRILENSLSLYIPGVTGSYKGTIELLKEAGITKTERGYKSIAELSDEEMSRLGTSIMLSLPSSKTADIVGNIYLVKFFNNIEDAREISALINACSRLDHSHIALAFCLGNKEIKKDAEKLYAQYKKTISSALESIHETPKISGKDYTIINAQDKIKDTIIGTIASIMSFSPLYPEGTVIIAMSYAQNSDKIKVSARIAGRKGRNVKEILHKATIPISTEIGGHPNAAGCLIPKDKESQFIENLRQTLEVEMIKV